MRNFYAFMLLAPLLLFSQETISFESSEGFTLGDINNQNSWITTNNRSDQVTVNNVEISDGEFSDGSYSLLLEKDPTVEALSLPSIGAIGPLNMSYPQEVGVTVSADFWIDNNNNTDSNIYEFSFINYPEGELGIISLTFGPPNNMFVYTKSPANPDLGHYQLLNYHYTEQQWFNVKIQIAQNGNQRVYINNNFDSEVDSYLDYNFDGLRILHDNWDGKMYVDNIKVYTEPLGAEDIEANSLALSLSPNPAHDFVNISLNSKDFDQNSATLQILSMEGKILKNISFTEKVAIQDLAEGVYLLKLSSGAQSITQQFIKK